MGNKELCLKLAKADSEKDVITILKRAGYWDDPDMWQYYGNTENNFATIGNQQSAADTALVEKIINSVDAVLMKECQINGIDPESDDAPQTIEEAQEEFFGITNGVLTNISSNQRSKLAENIMIVATGSKKNPSYSVIDKGEGQTPKKVPNTFLSLTKSNKLRIPFVQGKFNMGATGSLQFCGERNLQLVISRRCPKIADEDDETSKYWGFTIIRREDPSDNMKSSTFKYLAPANEILKIDDISLPLLPGNFPEAYGEPMEYGSFIKLYEYKMPLTLQTLITFNLYYRLSLLLPNVALPVFLKERRTSFKGHSLQTILSGLSVRLEQNQSKIIEDGFPSSSVLNISGQEIKVDIYAFKKDADVKTFKKKEGIIFTINGQSHGYMSKQFYNRNKVGMNYLSDSIFILVDCSKFDGRAREDLFMNSRDRLRDGALKRKIEKALEKIVKEHPGLRELKANRRQEDIKNNLSDAKPLAEILESVIKKSPTLSNLLISGRRITDPFNMTHVGIAEKYVGKRYPTYFKLKKNFSEKKPKGCPINQKFRVQFETDAQNDYFTRDEDPGYFSLYNHDNSIADFDLNMWNGIATLNCKLPKDSNPGDLVAYSVEVSDDSRVDPFCMKFFIKAEKPEKIKNAGNGQRVKPPGKDGKDREKPSALELPNIIEVYKEDWGDDYDRESALNVKDSGEEGYDFFVNMDNVYCLTEIKSRTGNDPEVLKAQYKYGMVLLGLSLIKSFEDEEQDEDYEPIFTKINNISKGIAPMLIPMINALGDLEPN